MSSWPATLPIDGVARLLSTGVDCCHSSAVPCFAELEMLRCSSLLDSSLAQAVGDFSPSVRSAPSNMTVTTVLTGDSTTILCRIGAARSSRLDGRNERCQHRPWIWAGNLCKCFHSHKARAVGASIIHIVLVALSYRLLTISRWASHSTMSRILQHNGVVPWA